MNSAWLTWSAPCLALVLLACQRDNPAFDPDVGGSDVGSEDSGDASTTQTSTTQTSTTQTSTTQTGDGDGDGDGDAGDGDGDGDGDATADGPDTGMEDPGILDMPVAECFVETHEGLWPRFGAPMQFGGGVCPPEIAMYVRVVGNTSGNWLAGACPGGCSQPCNLQVQYEIGADGLQVGLANLFPPVNFNPDAQWVGCYYVEAAALTKETDDACVYSSLSAHSDEGPGSQMLFNANRESWGLTPSAATHYNDWMPELMDTDMSCECDALEIGCCLGSTVVAKQFVIGDPVPPGEVGGLLLNQSPYTFYAAQAQGGTNCDIDPETSWALSAEQ